LQLDDALHDGFHRFLHGDPLQPQLNRARGAAQRIPRSLASGSTARTKFAPLSVINAGRLCEVPLERVHQGLAIVQRP
jgi:hypothetical protein